MALFSERDLCVDEPAVGATLCRQARAKLGRDCLGRIDAPACDRNPGAGDEHAIIGDQFARLLERRLRRRPLTARRMRLRKREQLGHGTGCILLAGVAPDRTGQRTDRFVVLALVERDVRKTDCGERGAGRSRFGRLLIRAARAQGIACGQGLHG